jgi:hypothetical protein
MPIGEGDTGPLQEDPPIMVGGGGSTLIWIRKDQNPHKVSAADVPAGAEKPAHPEQYEIYVLDSLECSHVKVNNGGGGNSARHPVVGRKHRTHFG